MLTIFITALIGTTGRDQQMAIIIFLQPSNGPIRTKLLYDWLRYKFTSQVDYAGPWFFARCANLAFPKIYPSLFKYYLRNRFTGTINLPEQVCPNQT